MSEKQQYDFETADKTKLKLTLSVDNNTLLINADGVDNKTLKYEGKFTKENLNNASKVFKMDDTLLANFPILKWCFEQKKVIGNSGNDNLNLTFTPQVLYLGDFHLSLKKLSIMDQVEKMGNKILGSDIGEKISKGIGGLKNIFGK